MGEEKIWGLGLRPCVCTYLDGADVLAPADNDVLESVLSVEREAREAQSHT